MESSTVSRERRRVALACKEMSSQVTVTLESCLQPVLHRVDAMEAKIDLVLSGLALLRGDGWDVLAAPPGLHVQKSECRVIAEDRWENGCDPWSVGRSDYQPEVECSPDDQGKQAARSYKGDHVCCSISSATMKEVVSEKTSKQPRTLQCRLLKTALTQSCSRSAIPSSRFEPALTK